MPKFMVYEIWTRAQVVEARDEHEALEKVAPPPTGTGDLSMAHAFEIPDDKPAPSLREVRPGQAERD